MGYSAALFMLVVLFSPLLLLFALIGFLAGKALRFFDPMVPGPINFLLVGLLGAGLVLLYGTVDTLIVHPARLQRDYLGERVASPLALRRFVHQPHVMDPGSEWIYALGQGDAERLRRSCRPVPPPGPRDECLLHSYRDDRSIRSATLTDRNRLVISAALH